MGFPGGSVVKNPPVNVGDQVRSLDQEDSPGEPIQYSGLEIPIDRGAWRATAHRVAELGRA